MWGGGGGVGRMLPKKMFCASEITGNVLNFLHLI